MADIYRIGVSLALTNGVSQVLGVMARDLLGFRGEIGKSQESLNRLKGVMLGVGAVMGGTAILGGMVKLVEHGEKLVHQQSLMAAAGMSVREQAEATATAYKASADVLGTTVDRNVAAVRELRGILGTTPDAIAAMPSFAKAGVVMHNVTGKDDEGSLQTLAKALELRGDVINPKSGKIDPALFKAGLDQAVKTIIASGGLITARDLMGVTKQAGPMARMMTAQQFYDTAFSAIMEMGGQRAGTALSAVGRAMYGGIMPKRNADEFARLNLLDMRHVKEGKGGSMRIDSGGFRGIDVLSKEGLLAYTERVLKPAMEKRGINTAQQQQIEMYRLFPTETSRRLIGLFLQQAETVRRDVNLRGQAQGVDAGYTNALANDPTAKMQAFKAAWENLLTSLGAPLVKPATDALVWVATEINKLTAIFAAHPDAVRAIAGFTAAFGGLLVLGGAIQVAAFALSPFTTGLRALVTTMSSPSMTLASTASNGLGLSLPAFAAGISIVAAAVGAWYLAYNQVKPAWDDYLKRSADNKALLDSVAAASGPPGPL